ncbi:unnamed protein product [Candida verbasci]|uniref:Uncharacterized protein n=1 Tax=Candida verbasci TaxID=1227364 RepID=A0A9W4XBP5_9ASCO|nr:unnamed protein product [Candida verbasci]
MLFIVFFYLLTLAFGKLRKVQLYVDSNYQPIDNYGLYPYKETNNAYYLFLRKQSYQLIYDDQNKYIYYQTSSQKKYYFKLQNNILQLNAGNPQKVNIGGNGRLQFNGANKLYAVKNIGDPAGVSKKYYAVKYYNNPPKGAYKVKYVYAKYI